MGQRSAIIIGLKGAIAVVVVLFLCSFVVLNSDAFQISTRDYVKQGALIAGITFAIAAFSDYVRHRR